MTELIGKIMAQVLSILALSTKTMKREADQWVNSFDFFFLID
jgi:hypothetical protein